ncbi:LexA family protein [Hoeflea sp.]|uniref:LexA family protein n=1 Tax=Hoeflea sp. TaxID=1940281 RepID=UPI003B529DCE
MFATIVKRSFCDKRYIKNPAICENGKMEKTQDHIRKWLADKIASSPRGTSGRLADALNLRRETISRMINEKPGREMREIKAREYAEMLRFFGEDEGVRQVEVIGHVQAGEWAESWEWDVEDRYHVTIHTLGGPLNLKLHAAEVRGPSMNMRYNEGTVLVFDDIHETGEAFTVGKRYIVEKTSADGLVEATVKTLWQDEAGHFWLKPESNDPRFQQAIPLDGHDGDTIRIIGRVRYAVVVE